MKPAREHPYDGSAAEAVRAGFCPVCRGTGSAEPMLAGKGLGPMTCPGCGGCGLWPPRDEHGNELNGHGQDPICVPSSSKSASVLYANGRLAEL